MGRYVMVVLTNPVAGLEEQFNDWYTNHHLSDVLALDEFVAAQRFCRVPKDGRDPASHRYMALYEVETEDVQATHGRLRAALDTPAMLLDPGFDRTGTIGWYFRPITDRLTG